MAVNARPLRKDAERNRQRIIEAARDLFTERGLGVTLNEVAHHGGVGVGTVYRHFPDREKLIEALYEQRLLEIRELLDAARANPNPWRGLIGFHERALELQARDLGLRDLLLGVPGTPERMAKLGAQLRRLAADLVEEARAAGKLRPDCEAEDLEIIHLMLGAVIDAGQYLAPELWRRYFAILRQGLKAKPRRPKPLSTPPVSPEAIDEVLTGASTQRRS